MIFTKIKETFTNKFNAIFKSNENIDEIIDEIEELLILSDVGMETTTKLCDNLRHKLLKEEDTSKENVVKILKAEMEEILSSVEDVEDKEVILVVGVNGVGKTTSIAKLANIYISKGKKVLLAAGDTFRAGAKEQLELWANSLNIKCVSGNDGADPSSVIFDASKEYVEGNYDILICDTAGRLHTKKNLMDEIEKIKRTLGKNVDENMIQVLMVIDATTGQNAVEQAKSFYDKTSVDGIVLTKLDSSAKGGVVFRIINELHIPIKYVGVGEKIEDIKVFDAKEYIDSIF